MADQNQPLPWMHLLALPLLFLAVTYGFTAGVPGSARPGGQTHWDLTADHQVYQLAYHLDPEDASRFEFVSISFRGKAENLYLGLGDGEGPVRWVSCYPGGGAAYECNLRTAAISVDQAVEVYIATSR